MNFRVDAQLPIALSDWLSSQGHNSVHTLSFPNRNKTSDTEILNFAEKESRIILSKDIDFFDSFILQGKPTKLLLLEIFHNNLNKIIQLFDHHLLIELNKNNLIVHR